MLVNCISTHNHYLSLIFIFYFLLMFTKALLDTHCNTLIDSMVVFIAGVSTLFDNQLDNSTNMVLQM